MTTTILAPATASNIKQATGSFPFGEIIQPNHDKIGNYLIEHGRKQHCIPADWLKEIERRASAIPRAPWKMGRWVHSLGKNPVYRVVTTNFGWRGERRMRHAANSNLGDFWGGYPILFPSAEAAISAIDVLNHYDDIGGLLAWVRIT